MLLWKQNKMDNWLTTHCNLINYSNQLANFYKSFSVKQRSDTESLLTEKNTSVVVSENKKSRRPTRAASLVFRAHSIEKDIFEKQPEEIRRLKKTFSLKMDRRKETVDKAFPVFSPALQTYNQSLFQKDNSGL